MADHARKQIRDAVATALTGLTTTASRVYPSRVYPHDTLPCLSIYTLTERAIEDLDLLNDSTKQHRLLSTVVEARAKHNDTVDDTLDTIAAEVEAAVLSNSSLAGLIKNIEFVSTDIELVGGDEGLENPAGLMTMVFDIEYRVDSTDPTTIIN